MIISPEEAMEHIDKLPEDTQERLRAFMANREKSAVISIRIKGGPGSGHFGHAGRPGKVGGSLPGSAALSRLTGKDARLRQTLRSAGFAKDHVQYLADAKVIVPWWREDYEDYLASMARDVNEGGDAIEMIAMELSGDPDAAAEAERQRRKPITKGQLPSGNDLDSMMYAGELRKVGEASQGISQAKFYELPNGDRIIVKKSAGGNTSNEAKTYELAEDLIAQDLVPPTRYLPDQRVSAQYMIPNSLTAFEIERDDRIPSQGLEVSVEDMKMIALLDTVTGNNDRHGGNVLFEVDTGKAWAIDNDRSFVGWMDEPAARDKSVAKRQVRWSLEGMQQMYDDLWTNGNISNYDTFQWTRDDLSPFLDMTFQVNVERRIRSEYGDVHARAFRNRMIALAEIYEELEL